MKRRTYRNCLIIYNRIRRKGYNHDEAQNMMQRIFDEYEANPQGLSIESREALIIDKKINILRRIDDFARDFDPYGYQDDLDFEITDEYLLENQESVVDFIRGIIGNIDEYDDDEKTRLLSIVEELKTQDMWERRTA